ncbi:UDP-N-acetylmuramoyl-tripeptide--D-alanyl-D-alanine ligase [[Phormidium ambiguum] IAM M-71]|uniref:UDP-N-acetylmuramoyl-tripeptide--D-alanyl-D- alanine ligase n=1 Tax=[Phormidium ambiguum] IAM M-71 TaxID=454136 RepID=UPI000A59BFF9|nr:UDP-N-acetylmuramoyl-tripeptide--D-alanyl-D-alanine ligase [Phormidium ambiguum]
MSCSISLAQLSEVLLNTSEYLTNADRNLLIKGISTDSRSISLGNLFIALRGDNFDGHEFVETAVKNGAVAVVTDKDVSQILPDKIPQLVVKDTLQAYQAIAQWWRNQLDIPVIAVTGSFGKTTTKELIGAVLATQGKVRKTQANYNNEIGVPKTLLEVSLEDDFAVIEMAMRGRGEIALLSKIARPNIGVITNVGTAHIGRLGSEAAIAEAKCELLVEMPKDSVAILNADNQLLMETAGKVWQGETIAYGLENGDFQGKLVDGQTLSVEGINLPLPLPGRHNAQNYLAALAVAKVLGIDLTQFSQGLAVQLPEGRAKRYDLPNDLVILDETYNAGLESMVAALHLLAETPGKRHIAVLGTMKELGDRSAQIHFQVGEKVKELNLDRLLILVNDPETAEIAHGAAGINSECFTEHQAIVDRLKELVQPGDRILFKASHSVALDKVVNQFRELVK